MLELASFGLGLCGSLPHLLELSFHPVSPFVSRDLGSRLLLSLLLVLFYPASLFVDWHARALILLFGSM